MPGLDRGFVVSAILFSTVTLQEPDRPHQTVNRELSRAAHVQCLNKHPRRIVAALHVTTWLNEAVRMYKVPKDANVRQFRLVALSALVAFKALFEDGLVAIHIHPKDGHAGTAHQVKMLLEKGGISFVILDKTGCHKDNMPRLAALFEFFEDRGPDATAQLMVFAGAAGDDCYHRVDEEVVVQEATLDVNGQ